MKTEFVSYNQAIQLRLLGIDEICFTHYWGEQFLNENIGGWMKNSNTRYIMAPLKQQVFRWFRDKYSLWFRPDYYDEMREYDYQGSIHQLGRYSSLASLDNCKTVEELEAKCIDKLIEIVKNK
jgi:hypothetical protein